MTEETRTYEVTQSGRTFRIDVPIDCRVSYAPIIGANGQKAYGGNALRIWRGTKANEVQLALFQDVTSFRDVGMPIMVRAVRKYGTGENDWFTDDGSYVGEKAPTVEKGWKRIEELIDGTGPIPEAPDDDNDTFGVLGSPSAWTSIGSPRFSKRSRP